MTEKTARLGTTTLHIQPDHELVQDELSLADGSGHEFRARLLTEVEPMEDGQNDGHLMLSFHDDGDWQGACALRPDQVLELMALCVRALRQLAPKDPVIGSSRSEQEENHRD